MSAVGLCAGIMNALTNICLNLRPIISMTLFHNSSTIHNAGYGLLAPFQFAPEYAPPGWWDPLSADISQGHCVPRQWIGILD
jgi:hypothetical protein